MSNIVNLIKERIDNLNMKTFHVISDYMISEKLITEDQVKVIYDEISTMNTNMDKHSVIFEIAAYNAGLITEEQLKDTITKFRGIEVVSPQEISKMNIVFDSFNEEMCKKYLFFQYKNPSSANDVKNIVVAFNYADKINTLLKRTVSEFRIRYTLPSYIEQLFANL